MKAYTRRFITGVAPFILNLGSIWRCDQLSTPAALPPGRNHGTQPMGGWVEPQAGLEVLRKR